MKTLAVWKQLGCFLGRNEKHVVHWIGIKVIRSLGIIDKISIILGEIKNSFILDINKEKVVSGEK